jgi:hypothetical protein
MVRSVLVCLLLALPFAATGCSKPKASPMAMEACKTSAKDADSCKSCCEAAGGASAFLPGNLPGSGCRCQ